MKYKKLLQKSFSRRAALIAGGKFVLISALISRMYYLQVIRADHYKVLSDKNRFNLRVVLPHRGQILDRWGAAIATSKPSYQLVLVPELCPDTNRTLENLNYIFPLTTFEMKRIRKEIKKTPGFIPILIKDNLSWDDAAQVSVNAPELSGVSVEVVERRFYPQKEKTGHIFGYVSPPSVQDLKKNSLLSIPGVRLGKTGIEKSHEEVLRGKPGSRQLEVDSVGRLVRELERKEAVKGKDIFVTLDIDLQRYVLEKINGESATVVVMNCQTGDVLSLASSPSFDPNKFISGFSNEEWKQLVQDTKSPLVDKTISGQYNPGSTFKMITALAALEKKAITTKTKFFCKGFIELGDSKFHCWRKHGHGACNITRALRESCDVFFYEMAKRTGIDSIANMARKFGLGDLSGIGIENEANGLIPDRKWKIKNKDQGWHLGETLISGIGQGYVLTTPLQMAVMTSRMVNGGYAVKPFLVRDNKSDSYATEGTGFPKIDISSSSMEIILKGMNQVTNHPAGTAYSSRINMYGMEMGGKTGTSQVRRIHEEEREEDYPKKIKPWIERDHALFVGYAPVKNPKFVVAIVVEHGGSGSTKAAPIARDVLMEIQRRNKKYST